MARQTTTSAQVQSGRAFHPLITHGHVQDSHATGKPVHLLQTYGLWLVESGSVELAIGDTRERKAAPAVFTTAPGTMVDPGPGTYLRYIAFLDDDVNPTVAIPEQIPPHQVDRLRRLLYVWTDTWWRSDQDLWRCNAQLTLFLLDLLPPADPSQPSTEEGDWLTTLRKTILQDLPHGPTAATMATAMGLSRSQLYRTMAQHSHQTVNELIQAVRLEEATRLLLTPQIRVASVGRMV
jgi:AraC-like DNA-binding protein